MFIYCKSFQRAVSSSMNLAIEAYNSTSAFNLVSEMGLYSMDYILSEFVFLLLFTQHHLVGKCPPLRWVESFK
jgi:hypothetical protein